MRRCSKETVAYPRPPCYELFFAPLAISLNPTDYEMVQFAYFVSKYGHAKQLRDDGGRYFDHPKATAWIYIHELGGRDPRIIAILLLHDIREDAYLMSDYRLNRNFGEETTLDVRSVTKLPKGKETIEEYFMRIIARGPRAILGKLCDRLHNIRTLGGCKPEKIAKQLAETKDILMPMLLPALRKCGEEWVGYADTLEQKLLEAMSAYA